MTAERLCEAADRLDALITEATPGPWAVSPEEFTFGTEVIWYDPAEVDAPDYTGTGVACGASFGEGVCTTADAAFIATMHPGLGKALAVWLRTFAGCVSDDHAEMRPALAVADVILGGAS